MKKIYFSLISIVLFAFASLAQESTHNWSVVSSPVRSLAIPSSKTAYISTETNNGSHGFRYYLKKTTDGFKSLTQVTSSGGSMGCCHLYHLFCVNSDILFYAHVDQGIARIFKSLDGGDTWTQIDWVGPYDISLYFLNEDVGYWAYYNNVNNISFFNTFGQQVFQSNKYIFEHTNTKIKFLDENTGFIISKDTLNNAVILKTVDAGYHWTETAVVNNQMFRDIHFVSDNVGLAIGTEGTILRTTDGGNTWQNINSNTTKTLHSIDFYNDNMGYIVGDSGLLLKTQNGGINWEIDNAPNDHQLVYVRAFADGNIYIKDQEGYVYNNKTDGIITIDKDTFVSVYPNPVSDIVHIEFSSDITDYTIALVNPQGERLLSTSSNTQISLKDFASGVYIVIIQANDQVYRKKIIKK